MSIYLIFCWFISCILLVLFILRLQIFNLRKLGVFFAMVHFILVFIIALLVYKNHHIAQIEFFWFLLMALDYPIMFLYITIKSFIFSLTGYSAVARSVFVPFIFHGIIGSLLYYSIGRGIEYYASKGIKPVSPIDLKNNK